VEYNFQKDDPNKFIVDWLLSELEKCKEMWFVERLMSQYYV
jgi:hypothetical protein